MQLFNKEVGKELIVVAEIGVNHEGSVEKAKELMELAMNAGADACKIQVGDVTSGPERKGAGFALSEKQVRELASYGNDMGIPLFASALSVSAVALCAELFPVIKVAARDFEDYGLLMEINKTRHPIIASVGDSHPSKAGLLCNLFYGRCIMLHTVQKYPTPLEEADIEKMELLMECYKGVHIGYSNHVIGPKACYRAVAAGASMIEVHFTDDKTREFRDHKLSFTPGELEEFIANSQIIRECLD